MKRQGIIGVLMVVLGCLAAPIGQASAAPGTGWELAANTYPTDLVEGVDAVQQVSAEAGVGTFTVSYREVESAPIAEAASDAEVQAALEAVPTIGSGDVSVTGTVPGVYTVTFVGALGGTHVAELTASGANVSVLTEGSASGTIGIDVFNVGARESNGTITVTDSLPSGLRAKEAGQLTSPGFFGENFGIVPSIKQFGWICTGNGTGPEPHVAGATVVTCTNEFDIAGGGGTPIFKKGGNHPQPILGISVEAVAGPGGLETRIETNHATIEGGGALGSAATDQPIKIGPHPGTQGVVHADTWFSNEDGTIDSQAGSHPYMATFVFDAATALNAEKTGVIPGGELRNLETEVPAGLVGDLHAIPQCTRQQLFNSACPPQSMVGRLGVNTFFLPVVEQVFNMRPAPGTPAELGFNYGNVPVYIRFAVRSGGDYGITARVTNIPQREAIDSVLTLWGVPGAESHNAWRFGETGCSQEEMESEPANGPHINYCYLEAGRSQVPILRMPTSCTSSAPNFAFRGVGTWSQPAAISEVRGQIHDATDAPAPFTGCGALDFEPAFSLTPESGFADTPTGLTADLSPPLGGSEIATALAPSDLRNAVATLAQGLAVNPGQAAGLLACPDGRPSAGRYGDALTTPEEAGRGEEDTEAASCPPGSRIGSVVIHSPAIEADEEKQLEGGIYVLPSNPPDVRLLLAASGDGINVKIAGVAKLNPSTGQITTVFENTPQLPFTDLTLKFDGGSHAALVTPKHCGSYETHADFTPWAGPAAGDALVTTSFQIGGGPAGSACPGSGPLPFGPTLEAGPTNASAGRSSTLVTKVSKADDQQNVKTIEVKLPEGQLAKLAGVPLCPESATASGECPAGAQVGTVTAAVGAGPAPLAVPQPGKAPTAVYLAGPYKGAPYSLVVKVPAQAGPFDLGNVITRVALQVNESTTQVTAVADPLPQILDGVPLEYKSIAVSVDRPGFVLNPTNCEPQKVTATIGGSEGATANLSNRYQVGDCASLQFKPPLKLTLSGQTKRLGHPALKAVLTYPKGNNANIARAQVNLPHSEFLDQGNLNKTCTKPVLIAGKCPTTTIYGRAKAWTPLLERPLEGPVYLVGGYGFKLPALVAELNGQLRVLLVGKVDSGKNKGIRNTFEAVPDAPVSRFVLELKGGKKYGLLENSESLCKKPQKAISHFTGQNGKTYDTKPLIQVTCGKKSKGKKSPKKK